MAETNSPNPSTFNDVLTETPDNVKAATATAERELLTRMLGIDFTDTPKDITAAIVRRIEAVRGGTVDAGLSAHLQRDITSALASVSGRPTNPTFPQELQEVQVIAEAVWRNIPNDITNDLVVYRDLIPAAAAATGLDRYTYRLPTLTLNGSSYDISLNLTHAFWTESGPFKNQAAFEAALTNHPLESAGITVIPHGASPPLPTNYYLSPADAGVIAISTFPGAVLAGYPSGLDVHTLQRELQARFSMHRRLMDGTDNVHGAALAAEILRQNRDPQIQSALGGGRDMTAVQADIRNSQRRTELQSAISNLKSLSLQTTRSWDDCIAITTGLHSARNAISAINTATGSMTINCGPETFLLSGATPLEKNQLRSQIISLEAAATKENQLYLQYSHKLADIQRIVRELAGNHALLNPYVDYDPIARVDNPVTTAFVSSMNVNSLLDEVLADPTLELDRKHDEDIARMQKELDDVRNGRTTGLTGAAAQHAVMCKYFEVKHRLSPTQAAQAANYVRGRSQIDAELSQLAQDTSDDLYGDDRSQVSRFFGNVVDSMRLVDQQGLAIDIVNAVARSNGVRRSKSNRGASKWSTEKDPQWSTANHRQLISSYFALKKLYEGNGPKDLKLAKSQYVQSQMRLITQAILNKHALRALQDFGPMLGISNQEMQDKLKEMSKTEIATMLDEFLHGEEPDAYKARVQQSINYADKHASWAQRQLSRGVRGTAGYMGNKAVAIRKGIGGGVGATAKGIGRAGKAVVYDAPKAVVKGVWNNKGSIATVTALSLLGGPIAGIGAWYAMKQFGGNKSQAA